MPMKNMQREHDILTAPAKYGTAGATRPGKASGKRGFAGVGAVIIGLLFLVLVVALIFLSLFISTRLQLIDSEGVLTLRQQERSSAQNGQDGAEAALAEAPDVLLDMNKVRIQAKEFELREGEPLTVAQIAEKVRPSVVGIVTESDSVIGSGNVGSGVIATEDGYIITNAHVIADSVRINVILDGGDMFTASVIGTDERTDLALLHIDKKGLTSAEFGDSDQLRVGDMAVAIGNPLGMVLQGTVTQGIISAINRDVMISESLTMTLLQTDAAINPGNSGGPLINQYGQVIGINTRKLVNVYIEGIGFAIPYNSCEGIILELAANGYISGRPSIGIRGFVVDERTANAYKVPLGVYVEYVEPYSDAAQRGLMRGDIITELNGVRVKNMNELNAEKDKLVAGDTVVVKVHRTETGQTIEISFMLMDEQEIERNSQYAP